MEWAVKVENGVIKVLIGEMIVMKDNMKHGLYILHGKILLVRTVTVASNGEDV